MSELTRDTPARGVVVHQPRRGFRYATEPFLLAGWLLERHAGVRVLDVGTGSGIIALLLAAQGMDIEGVDVLAEWVSLARRSASDSGLDVPFRVADIREPMDACYDLAISNPPFFPRGGGPLPADPFRAAGRHEIAGDLRSIVAGMARVAPIVALVLPMARAAHAEEALRSASRPPALRCDVGDTFALLEGRVDAERCERESVPLFQGGRVAAWYTRVGSRAKPAV